MAFRSPAPPDDEKPAQGTVVKPLLSTVAPLPEQLAGKIDLSNWAESLVNKRKYVEPDPDYLSRLLIVQTLTAETPDDVFEQLGLIGLQKAVANVPEAGTGPFELTDLYVTGSDLGEDSACYVILECTSLDTGVITKYTTGANQIQAQLLRLLSLGVWPIRGNIKRLERKDKGGRYLFWMYPPD